MAEGRWFSVDAADSGAVDCYYASSPAYGVIDNDNLVGIFISDTSGAGILFSGGGLQ